MPRSTPITQPLAASLAVAERPAPDATPFAPEVSVFTWADPQAELVAALAALVRYHLDVPGVSDSAAAAPLAPAA
jgi:hypothetical protein